MYHYKEMSEHTSFRNMVPPRMIKLVLSSHDLFEEFSVFLVEKWRITAEENVGDDTQRPHVYFFAVSLSTQYFGSYFSL